jgi:hypothetical protein
MLKVRKNQKKLLIPSFGCFHFGCVTGLPCLGPEVSQSFLVRTAGVTGLPC